MRSRPMNSRHVLLCAALLILAAVLWSTGLEVVAFLPLLVCGLMMGAMLWLMMRAGRGGSGDG